MLNISLASIIARTVSSATPLVTASSGDILCERSGITNVGIEGMMLIGAFSAALGSYYTGSAWLGLLFGILGGTAVSLLHAWLCITVKINHVISGLAINIFASNMSVYLMYVLFGVKGTSPSVASLPPISIPLLNQIPVLSELFSGISVCTILGILLMVAASIIINRTAFGMHIIASGKNPTAASTVGINVTKIRYLSVMLAGVSAGIAGSYLSISYMNSFVKNMISGRGFIAVATIICGYYKPGLVAVAGLCFGFLDAMQMALQGTVVIPAEIIQCIPYLATILAVAIPTLRQQRNHRLRIMDSKRAAAHR